MEATIWSRVYMDYCTLPPLGRIDTIPAAPGRCGRHHVNDHLQYVSLCCLVGHVGSTQNNSKIRSVGQSNNVLWI